MKVHICIKQVPDVNASVDTGRMVLNAYDASAVEEALVLRDKAGGSVDLVLIGPDKAKETIRKALAMGADNASHIVAEDADFDSSAYASILADYFGSTEYDVILCGKQAQDTDAGLTGPMLATLLDIPYTTNAVGLDIEDGKWVVTRQGDSGQEIIELAPPCLITCSNDMNDPRIPSLKGIMAAKRKTINAVTLDGPVDVAVGVEGYEDVPDRPPGVVLEGDVDEVVEELGRKLTSEAKVL